MQTWLQGYSYRIALSPMTFIIAGALALLIALLSVGYQALKASVLNPVQTLKYE